MIKKLSILITGSNSGFGKLAVKKMAEKGYKVFATMRNVNGKNKTYADEIINWSKNNNYDVEVIEMDVTDEKSVINAYNCIINNNNDIDVIINNSGIYSLGFLETYTSDDLKNIIDVNVLGVMRVTNTFLPLMRKKKDGLIIFVSSVNGRFVLPFTGTYTVSKYALEALAESYCYELSLFGIDTVILEPGAFQTNLINNAYKPSKENIVDNFGEVKNKYDNYWENMSSMFKETKNSDPDMVAESLLNIIETPKGERPLRVVVDNIAPQGIKYINEITNNIQYQTLNAINMKDSLSLKKTKELKGEIEVKDLPEQNIAYVKSLMKNMGSEDIVNNNFKKLFDWAESKSLIKFPDTKVLIVYHDDLLVTRVDTAKKSASISVPSGTNGNEDIDVMKIPGGKYLTGKFEMGIEEFGIAWDTLVNKWMPENKYIPDTRPWFELCLNNPEEHPQNKHVVEICIPVKQES